MLCLAFQRVPVSRGANAVPSPALTDQNQHTHRTTLSVRLHSFLEEEQSSDFEAGVAKTSAMLSATSCLGSHHQSLSRWISTGARFTTSSGFTQTQRDMTRDSTVSVLWP